MLDPHTLRAVREMYLTARRNGLPPTRAQAHAARKARELGAHSNEMICKYVTIVINEEESQ